MVPAAVPAAAAAVSAKVHDDEAVGFLEPAAADADAVANVTRAETEAARGSVWSCRLRRRFVLLMPVALVSMVFAVWGLSAPPKLQEWMHGSMQRLWLTRSEDPADRDEGIADCVFDSQFATQNFMAFGLSIAAVSNSCPAAQAADDLAKQKVVDGAKAAHEARMVSIFGEKPEKKEHGGFHNMASATLERTQKILDEVKREHKAWRQTIPTAITTTTAPKNTLLAKIHNAKKKADERKAAIKAELEAKKAAAEKKKREFEAVVKSTQESVQSFEDAKLLAKVGDADRRICAADVSSVLARMSYVAANLAHLTSECQSIFDQKAYCAGDITRLLAGVSMTAASAAEISASCTELQDFIGADVAPDEFGRRLGPLENPVKQMFDNGLNPLLPDKKARNRNFELTVCVTTSWFAATFFARFLDMSPAVLHCGQRGRGSEHCAAAIIDLVSALSWTASSISYAVAECPKEPETPVKQPTFCAAGITKLIAALADVAAASSVVGPTCYNKNSTDTTR